MTAAIFRRRGTYRLASLLLLYAASGSLSLAYDRKDAGFVTTSKNKAVLDYIVCLEGVVADTPKRMAIETSLGQAEAKCKAMAAKLPRFGSEPNAQDLRYSIMECGFRSGEASPDMGCGEPVEKEKPPTVDAKPSAKRGTAGQYNLSQIEQTAVVDGVKARLKDPVSAIFGGVVAKKDPDVVVYVCGSVNAKNSYGGYTGHEPYSGMLIGNGAKVFFAVVGIAGSEDEATAILSVCHDRGLL